MGKKKESLAVLANAYLEEGKNLIMNNKVRDAEKLVLRAKELFEQDYDGLMYANTLNVLGVIYSAMDDNAESVSCYMEGLSHAQNELKQCEDEKRSREVKNIIGVLYNNIGSRYQLNEDYVKALKYYELAENTICYEEIKDDPTLLRRGYVIYLNFAECNGQLDRYDKAWEYLMESKKYKDYGDGVPMTFSYTVLEFKLRWVRGEQDYVREHFDEFVNDAIYNHVGTDYMEDMRGTCSLCSWMGEFDAWKKILISMEEQKDDWNSISYDMMITEIWMGYYKQLGDEENHLQKCKEYAYQYQKLKKATHKAQAEAIDMRIAFLENEEERKQATEKSCTDNLTCIGNRNKLEQDVVKLLPELIENKRSLGLGIVDIDYFKQQNDTYGHLQGDECLKTVASIIKKTIAGKGEVYRFGGDEFVLIIPDSSRENIKKLAAEIKEKLHEKAIPNKESKVLPEVTLSQGYVCISPKTGDNIESLMAIADKSLYNVKENGRNSYNVI